jgi:hypothetical protein
MPEIPKRACLKPTKNISDKIFFSNGQKFFEEAAKIWA